MIKKIAAYSLLLLAVASAAAFGQSASQIVASIRSTTCTNQFIRAIAADGSGTCATPAAANISGLATIATDGSASSLVAGTVATTRGGAGTITGVLRGNGSGIVSQAGCVDLNDIGPYCTALRGQLPGTTTNDNASAGNIGEYLSASVLSGSAVSLTTSTAANISSGVALTAGDWQVCATLYAVPTGTTNTTLFEVSISTTSATRDTTPGRFAQIALTTGLSTNTTVYACDRFSVSGSTTVNMVAFSTFTASTMSAYGKIQARRVR